MRVVYSGCNWNTVVFTMDNNQIQFENWLAETWKWFQETVRADPIKYRSARKDPGFTDFIVTPSRDPEMYPNELRCRLSTTRLNDTDVCTAVIECNNEQVDPSQVWKGSHMTPVFRLNYFKDAMDNYGLQLTVLKAEYEPSSSTHIQNDAWMIDSNTSGSGSLGTGSVFDSDPVLNSRPAGGEECMIVI